MGLLRGRTGEGAGPLREQADRVPRVPTGAVRGRRRRARSRHAALPETRRWWPRHACPHTACRRRVDRGVGSLPRRSVQRRRGRRVSDRVVRVPPASRDWLGLEHGRVHDSAVVGLRRGGAGPDRFSQLRHQMSAVETLATDASSPSKRRHRVACAICGRRETRHLYEKSGYGIGACTGCGLVFANPRAPEDKDPRPLQSRLFLERVSPVARRRRGQGPISRSSTCGMRRSCG